jgi:tRNA A-37 threonylcarbamoyl transferase component Bud32
MLPEGLAELYEVHGTLGQGGMGVVYRARHRKLDRAVALKLLLAGMNEADLRDRFRREAKLLAELAHPGVVRLLDADVAGDTPYIAMELLEGDVLSSLLTDGPMPPAEARALVLGLLDALGQVHAKGLLHRDLKPSNIFMRDGKTPVLIDFGLARKADATLLTEPGSLIGTPKYFAPELVRGDEHTASSDLFAVAMTGLDALTLADVHRTAGQRDKMMAICRSLTSGDYHAVAVELLAPFDQLGEVLAKALHPDPAQRYASAAAMAGALRAVRKSGGAARPVKSVRSSAPAPAPAAEPARARLAAVAALVMLAFAGGTAFLVAPAREASPPAPASPTSPTSSPRAQDEKQLMDELWGANTALEKIAREVFREYRGAMELPLADAASRREARRAYLRRSPDFAKTLARGRELFAVAQRNGRALLALRLPVEQQINAALALYSSLDAAAKLGVAAEKDLERWPLEWIAGLPENAGYHFFLGMTGRFWETHEERYLHMRTALELLEAGLGTEPDATQMHALVGTVSELVDAAKRLPGRDQYVRAAFARLQERRRRAAPAAVNAALAAQIAKLEAMLQRP